LNLTDNDISIVNNFEMFYSFEKTWDYKRFVRCPHKVIAQFTGNQKGKTAGIAYQYVERILGWHPIPDKNVLYFECPGGHLFSPPSNPITAHKLPFDNICPHCGGKIQIHKRNSKTFRFCAETLPGEKGDPSKGEESGEVRNTTYPAFKKWLPPFLVKRDITFRNPAMHIADPYSETIFGEGENALMYKGGEIIVEFVSYNQAVQAGAGVQRMSIFCDEEPPKDFYEEQLPRLVAEDGDFIIGLTPASRITWCHDEIFERARLYIRTDAVCGHIEETTGERPPNIERTDAPQDIAVIQAAMDDNPTLSIDVIERLMSNFDDPDVVAIRRYGIFKQVSGRIFKDFSYRTHVIDAETYFPDGEVPNEQSWLMARMIDYHESNPWAIPFAVLSPENEMFIFWEWAPSPEKFTTLAISERVAEASGDYRFPINLIDSLAAKNQVNTNTTVIEDMNHQFGCFKREGLGTGGFWQSWDTKNTKGRDKIRERLKNSVRVKNPFNNLHIKDGKKTRLPTLWIFGSCRQTAESLHKWRLEEWATSKMSHIKEPKEQPAQKHSHFCVAIEAILKDVRWKPRPRRPVPKQHRNYGYMQGGRAYG